MRYAHVMMKQYINSYGYQNIFIKKILEFFLKLIAKWDIKHTKNVDYFIANSILLKKR